jgi:hypothetical protein
VLIFELLHGKEAKSIIIMKFILLSYGCLIFVKVIKKVNVKTKTKMAPKVRRNPTSDGPQISLNLKRLAKRPEIGSRFARTRYCVSP